MHKSRLKEVTLAVLLALVPVASDATGLGRLTVLSGLGEKFSAEVELLSTTPGELSSLQAGIASQETYQTQGMARSASLDAIRLNSAQRQDGTPILTLSSTQAVNDSFLNLLIQMNGASGKILREYTVLLDPPGSKEQLHVYTGVQLPLNAATMVAPSAGDGNGAMPRQLSSARAPSASAQDGEGATYTTSPGDTLTAIARQHLIQGISLDQMLVSLYHANEQAFINKNMNLLKVGEILRVPGANEAQQVTASEASQEIRVQTADWNAYRGQLAELVADSVPSTEGGVQQSASGHISSAATDQSEQPESGPRDIVKLSGNNAENDSAQAQLNAMQEELTAKDKSLNEATERTAMLEKQIADMQQLLAIKNEALANLQNAEKATVSPELGVKDETQPENIDVQDTEEPAAVDNAVAQPLSQQLQQKVQQLAAKSSELVHEVVGRKSLLWALIAALVIFLLGGWWYARGQRKREVDSFERSIWTAREDQVTPLPDERVGTVSKTHASTDSVAPADKTSDVLSAAAGVTAAGAVMAGDNVEFSDNTDARDEKELDLPEPPSASSLQIDIAELGAATVDSEAAELAGSGHLDLRNIDLGEVRPLSAIDETADMTLPEYDLDIEHEKPAAPDINLSGISLNVAGGQESAAAADSNLVRESAAVDTKLDLVTAYMDMGDNDGARELLEQVINEGGTRQKQKAQAILDKLS
ncbi:FimV/HubP family polar landmark protein [Methylobacillus rhizosphaerae]|uniref:FimV/HubP family polar landmark protein n=1 Tax=Methylobacillus rhizosphaerae TaxID=551994 RepID=UPI0015C65135|nr:FimV/HubP family polar landmark protein [Methylobacillus rhizosphaerae]